MFQADSQNNAADELATISFTNHAPDPVDGQSGERPHIKEPHSSTSHDPSRASNSFG